MINANSDEEEQVQKLLAELTHGPVALSSAPENEIRRARLLPRLREQVSQIPLRNSRRAARKRRMGWTLGAAAVLLAGLGLGRWVTSSDGAEAQLLIQPRGSAVDLVVLGQHQVVTRAMPIAASGRLETTEDAALTTSEGVLLELSAHTRVGLDELNARSGWRLQLRQGHVACEVPKLTGKKTFSVVTNDAEVVVHGTRFTVTSDDTSTCVRVTEGRVEVRAKATTLFLDPGQTWGCDRTSTPPLVPAPDSSTTAGEPDSNKLGTKLGAGERRFTFVRPENKGSAVPAQSPPSTLAQETELVGRALTAERRGQHTTARALYAELVSRYPNSPMAPEARRGLQRVAEND
jgi:ferric-dicitrate binding protein FerR (iron transport regulator)